MDAEKRVAVMAMVAERRYAYFVKRAADLEQVWGLHDRDWATATGPGGVTALPFWPDREFAAASAVGAWERHVPKAIALGDLLTALLPELARDAKAVAVFPTDRGTCIFARPEDLLEAIHRELWQVNAP